MLFRVHIDAGLQRYEIVEASSFRDAAHKVNARLSEGECVRGVTDDVTEDEEPLLRPPDQRGNLVTRPESHTSPTHDAERMALIAEVGRHCTCGIDLYRNGCYRCLKARGAVWTCTPAAEAQWHGSANPYLGR